MGKYLFEGKLCQSGLLRRHVTPLLDDGLINGSGVGPGPGADLLGDIDTLLSGGELGHQLGHVLAGPLGLEGAGLLGGVLDNGLLLVITLLSTFLEPTASRGTDFSRNVFIDLFVTHFMTYFGSLVQAVMGVNF